jgi:hypothetical protein
MLKKVIVCLCLAIFIGTVIGGYHAEAKTDKGHGVEGSVG